MNCVLTLPSLWHAAWWRPALWSETHSDAEFHRALALNSEVSADKHAAAGRAPAIPNIAKHKHTQACSYISIQFDDLHYKTSYFRV